MDADYANEKALLANIPAQAESLLHSLERAAADIGPHINPDKTKYMCFNRRGDISTLKFGYLKQMDKFTYLGRSVSSTEKYINMRQAKAWTTIDTLPALWKSDLTDRVKRSFFQAAVVLILLYECTTWTLTKRMKTKLDSNYTSNIEQVLKVTPHKMEDVRPSTTPHENYPS